MAHVVLVESKVTHPFEIIRQARCIAGHEVTFVTSEPGAYLKGRKAEETDLRHANRVIELRDSASLAGLEPALSELNRTRKIDAIVTISEPHLVATAEMSALLNLRHTRLDAVRKTRNKFLTREALHARGVPQPRYRLAQSLEQALAAEELGYPLAVKPVDGSGSINARIVTNRRELLEHAEVILRHESYGRGTKSLRVMLVEEFVPGPLVSCEMLTVGGRHHLLGITDRVMSAPPMLAEMGGCFPARLPQQDRIAEVCRAALDAVGFDFGASHTELILGPDGPVIVEINGRLVGGLVPEMMDHALGTRMYLDVISLHLGESNILMGEQRGVACVRAFSSPADGRVADLQPSPLAADPRVKYYSLSCHIGDSVRALRSNRERLGFAIVLERDQETATALAEQVLHTTRLVINTEASV